jgi:DNA repair protein SbcC/Rad50
MLRKLFKNGKGEPPTRGPKQPPGRRPEAGAGAPPADEPSPSDGLSGLPRDAALAHIAALDDGDALLDLALTLRDELRRAVLEHPLLRTPERLAALEKRSRNRDKSLNRHARRQLDRYRSLQQDAQSCRSRAEELVAAIVRHDAAVDDRAAEDRRITLNRRLAETIDRYQGLAAELAGFAEPPPELAIARPEPEQLEAAPTPGPEPAGQVGEDPFAALVEGFENLDHAMLAAQPFDEIAAMRQALTERWLTEADHRPPAPPQHRVFEAVSHRFRELADAIDRLGDDPQALPPADEPLAPPTGDAAHTAAAWTDYWREVAGRRDQLRRIERTLERARWPAWAPPSSDYAALLAARERVRADLQAADRVQTERVDGLTQLIDRLAAAIDGGHLIEARAHLADAHAAHDVLPRGIDRRLGQRLGQQASRLAELKDWQTFATTPKREALVTAMTALVDAPLAPPDQADRIKALRRDWQALGPVTQAADGRLADRFNALAEAAFEPCRQYFAEQAERRRANLSERRRICDQLERYLDDTDWAQADMHAAERILRAAREEWRQYHPVERSAGKALDARFEAAQSRLHDKVKAEWERNVRAREALVAEAEQLLEAAEQPVAARIEAIKTLQHRWREVGITPHGPNQRLWRRFRQACDGVFAQRDQSRRRAEAQTNAQIDDCRRVLDAFEGRLQALGAADASEAELREFRGQLEGLERLPAAARRDLAARRGELIGRYQALLGEQARSRRLARLEALERDDAAAGAPGDAVPVDPAPDDAVRRLAVRAELAAGLPSPAADEALRLEVQVDRLQAGLSGDGASDDVDGLLQRWQSLGAKGATAAPLRQRFFAALRALESAR